MAHSPDAGQDAFGAGAAPFVNTPTARAVVVPGGRSGRGVLRIEVVDTRGDRLPEVHKPAPDDESGRGLLLVDTLADRWGVAEDHFPRKIVWAELRLTPPKPGS